MNIKRAEVKDSPIISRIHAESWKKAYMGMVPQDYLDELGLDFWEPAFENWIEKNILKAALIYDGEKAVGCAAYGKSRDENKADWGEIVSLYLLPEYFGKGFGAYLMKFVLEDLKSMGYKQVFLWVLDENSRAREFYEKAGFKNSGEELEIEIMGKTLRDLRYEIIL